MKKTIMINIPPSIEDPNYRYKMPMMELKIQGSGNGVRTNIINLESVAKSLRIDKNLIHKFITIQKGSQTIIKQQKSGKIHYIIPGKFNKQEMQECLDKFIEKYICCSRCKYPETRLVIVKQKLRSDCSACGLNLFLNYNSKKDQKFIALILKNKQILNCEFNQKQKTQDQIYNFVKQNQKEKEKNKQEKQVLQYFPKIRQSEKPKFKNIQFGKNEQLAKLIQYFRQLLFKQKVCLRQQEKFSFNVFVEEINCLELKHQLLSFIVFNTLFTVNIASQSQLQNVKLYKKLMKEFNIDQQQMQTYALLNLQYLFLQMNRQKDFSKFLPSIMVKLYERQLFTSATIRQWISQGGITGISQNYLFDFQRDYQFKSLTKEFIQWLQQNQEQQEECLQEGNQEDRIVVDIF